MFMSKLANIFAMVFPASRPFFALLLALACAPAGVRAQISGNGDTPLYTPQSIVNAATQTAGPLAPNTIATIYGTALAFETRAVASSDIVHGAMPTSLDGVGVWVDSIPCGLFFVSPTQINFLMPYMLGAGTYSIIVARDGLAGPSVSIQVTATSPGLFLYNGGALAVHLDGQVISSSAPAVPGEIIVIYANGLGRTSPDASPGQLATGAFQISYVSQLQILLNGVPCPAGSVLYAGLTPGFAGLYQINLTLPPDASPNPYIQITIGPEASAATVQISVQ
jgi:uncharacterized protein (TIGR03437 family)